MTSVPIIFTKKKNETWKSAFHRKKAGVWRLRSNYSLFKILSREITVSVLKLTETPSLYDLKDEYNCPLERMFKFSIAMKIAANKFKKKEPNKVLLLGISGSKVAIAYANKYQKDLKSLDDIHKIKMYSINIDDLELPLILKNLHEREK